MLRPHNPQAIGLSRYAITCSARFPIFRDFFRHPSAGGRRRTPDGSPAMKLMASGAMLSSLFNLRIVGLRQPESHHPLCQNSTTSPLAARSASQKRPPHHAAVRHYPRNPRTPGSPIDKIKFSLPNQCVTPKQGSRPDYSSLRLESRAELRP